MRVGCGHGGGVASTLLCWVGAVLVWFVLAVQVDVRVLGTVEGLGFDPIGRRVGEEFLSRRAYQCGFCTAGFEMLATWFARVGAGTGPGRAREVAASNLCRCTGYAPISDAFEALDPGTCEKQAGWPGRCVAAAPGDTTERPQAGAS